MIKIFFTLRFFGEPKLVQWHCCESPFSFFISVDENHSGDSPTDLFADEQLLHHKARHFRPVIKAWSVRPKPKSEVSKVGDGLQTSFTGLLDSALPIKTPTEPISIWTQTSRSTTDNSTGDERTTPTPAVMDNLKVTIHKEHIIPQTIVKQKEASNVEPSTPSVRQAQNMLVRSSNLGHIKTNESVTAAAAKVVVVEPALTEITTNRTVEKKTSVSPVTENGIVTKENLKENASMLSMENLTQSTFRRTTPLPTPHSDSLTVTERSLGSTAHTRATTTIVTSPRVIESKRDSVTHLPKMTSKQTLTSVPSLMTTTKTTTTTSTTTSKPGKRKYSINWDEEEEVVADEETERGKAVKTVVEESVVEGTEKMPGIAL